MPIAAGHAGHDEPIRPGGDRLWVRESFSARKDGQTIKIRYPADGPNGVPMFVPIDQVEAKYATQRYFTRPGRYMPRWATRLVLEVISVQLERLQDITEAAAEAEGFANNEAEQLGRPTPITARAAFQAAWDQFNASRGYGWGMNPWVYVIRFRLLHTKGTSQ